MTDCQVSDKVFVEECGNVVSCCHSNEVWECAYAHDSFTDEQLNYSFNGYVGDWRQSYAAHIAAHTP